MSTPGWHPGCVDERLSAAELARWTAWKRATDAVMRAVAADVDAATGLSSADFSVLTRLVEEGGGTLRQQELSDELGWERSRLSRQLGRMATRGLVVRGGDTTERRITATEAGRRLADRARTVHAAAVRRALLDRVPPQHATAFWEGVDALG